MKPATGHVLAVIDDVPMTVSPKTVEAAIKQSSAATGISVLSNTVRWSPSISGGTANDTMLAVLTGVPGSPLPKHYRFVLPSGEERLARVTALHGSIPCMPMPLSMRQTLQKNQQHTQQQPGTQPAAAARAATYAAAAAADATPHAPPAASAAARPFPALAASTVSAAAAAAAVTATALRATPGRPTPSRHHSQQWCLQCPPAAPPWLMVQRLLRRQHSSMPALLAGSIARSSTGRQGSRRCSLVKGSSGLLPRRRWCAARLQPPLRPPSLKHQPRVGRAGALDLTSSWAGGPGPASPRRRVLLPHQLRRWPSSRRGWDTGWCP